MRQSEAGETLQNIKKPKEQREDATRFKEMVLALFVLIAGVVSWGVTVTIVNNSFWHFNSFNIFTLNFSTVTFSVLAVLFFSVYISFYVFTAVYVRGSIFIPLAFVTALLPLLLFFFEGWSVLFLGVLIFFFGILAWRHVLKRAYRNQRNFSLYGMLRPGLSIIITLVLINVSLLYFIDFSVRGGDTARLENATVSYSVVGINKILAHVIDGYSARMSVDNFIMALGTSRLSGKASVSQNSGLSEELAKVLDNFDITDSSGSSFLQQQKRTAREQFFESLGMNHAAFNGETHISDVWAAFVRQRIAKSLASIEKFIPLIIALGLFFTLIIFKFIYKAFIVLFAWIIYKLLFTTKFFYLKEDTISIKRLSL